MTRRSDAPGLRPPKSPRIEDAATDQAIREHERTFADILNLPAAALRVINDVDLPEGIAISVPHGLGRAPRCVLVSAVRNDPPSTGRIVEVRQDVDRTNYLKLKATGFTVTVTVDVVVL